jgi:hypothetical protein
MSSSLLIIGNGFDLQCNLRTRYSDFFKDNLKKNNWYKYYFDSRDNFEFWDKILAKNGANFKLVFNGDTPDDFTIWDALFILKNHNCNRWCDVEYEISESFKLISNMEICLWDKTYIFLKDGVSSLIEEGNSCKLLIIEKQLALIAYSLFFKGKIDEVEIDDFYEFLLEHLNKFEKRFAQYVSELTDWKYYAEAELLLKKLLFLDNGATNNVVLSFNYTDLHELD